MTERIWFNGRIIPMSEAHISVEDRGFQFADGVYEVIRLYGGRPFAVDEHLSRLTASAAGIQLALPLAINDLAAQIQRFIQTCACGEGMIYLQLTRGVAPRNHLFPPVTGQEKVAPTLLFYFHALPPLPAVDAVPGVKLVTQADERWKKCWIKSIALLPNVLAKNAAISQGADEAVLIHEGMITECSASNIFGVIRGEVVTHPVGEKVLPGITRQILMKLAPDLKIAVRQRGWSEAEALSADELFITSSTREISWVSHWNNQPLKSGRLGPVTRKLHEALRHHIGG